MRILYHHRTRAADAQGVHIAEMIRAFEELGHEVEMAALVTSPQSSATKAVEVDKPLWQRVVQGIPFFYELLQLGYNLIGLWIIVKAIRRFRPDFIYERYSLFNFAGILAARWYGIPLVLEVNSPLAQETKEEGQLKLYRLGLWTERVICNSATAVVVVTAVLGRILTENGVRPELLHVIPNGIAPDKFKVVEPDVELRRQCGLEGRLVIGFVGWFRPWHGLEMLVEAFHAGELADAGAALLLVGDGPAMPELRQLVKRLGLENSVVFSGPLPHAEVARFVALFDLAAQPAANPYCCPMKIIEYLALGKPVLAPAQDNIRELLEDGLDAILFEPGDAGAMATSLRRLTSSPELVARLTANACQSVERRGFLWTRNAERVVGFIAGEDPVAAELRT
jgi:glycosyltransferase involved in cell wall biosynthesis